MTTAVAVVFMLTSLWLAYFAVHKGSSVMQGAAPAPIEQTVPAPAAPPAPEKK
jgi:preprotein translocase subunit SecG